MTKLDQVIERIRRLPQEEQDEIAEDLEYWLGDQPAEAPSLTPEQREDLARRLADPNKVYIPHEEVVAYFEKKYGR